MGCAFNLDSAHNARGHSTSAGRPRQRARWGWLQWLAGAERGAGSCRLRLTLTRPCGIWRWSKAGPDGAPRERRFPVPAPPRAHRPRAAPRMEPGGPPTRTCLSFHQHPGDAQGPATLGRIPVAGGFQGGTPGNNSQLVLRAWGEVGAPLCAELRADLGALHPYTPLDPEICLGRN